MASLPCFRAPCVPRRGEAQPRARSLSLAPCRARSRRAKNLSLLVAADASSSSNDAVASTPPPSTDDDIDALISALAKTTLGAGIDEKELFKLLRPSSSPAKAGGKAPSGGEKGGAAAAEGARATSSSSASSAAAPTSNTKSRKLGPAELLKNLLAASAPDAEAAATGTVRLLQSLDDDDEDAFSSYEEDYESDGESSSAAAAAAASASTSSADFSSSSASSDAVVGPRLRAELGTLVLKAFDTAAGMTASSFPDAARAASRGRLTRESLAALLGRDEQQQQGAPSSSSSVARRDAAAVDDLLLRFGLRDGSSGELYLGYAGFLKLLASEVADLRAVLRYAALEVPAAVGEAEAAADAAEKAAAVGATPSSSSSASASMAAIAAPPATSPSLATSSADFTFRPGSVALIFGGDDLDAACACAGPGGLVCVQAGFTWCSPCKKFAPIYAAFASSYENITFLKFHANSNEATKALFKERLKVPQTPAFALLRDGKLVAPLVLGANAERLAAALSEAAASELGKGRGEDPLQNATEFEKQVFMSRLTAGARKV